jgi:hypothetical protein
MQDQLLKIIALISNFNLFLAGAAIALPISLAPVPMGKIQPLKIAQTPPANTYQPGFWQPAARLDVSRPITIKLINETDVTLNYDLTTNIDSAPENLEPGKEATFKGFVLPAYLLINPATSLSDPSEFNLHYKVVVNSDNAVIVKIHKVGTEKPRNTTLNIHETGAIYIY